MLTKPIICLTLLASVYCFAPLTWAAPAYRIQSLPLEGSIETAVLNNQGHIAVTARFSGSTAAQALFWRGGDKFIALGGLGTDLLGNSTLLTIRYEVLYQEGGFYYEHIPLIY